ncbi:MAG TPA: site-2 protease family protein [Candidatus Acidoferrales bacterium]|jgi:Zn-dependent protease|nr:site-2 protease family protein [Candidatus Acidoferrales bacterium]
MVRHATSRKEVTDLVIAWLGVSLAFYLAFSRPDFSSVSVEYVVLTLSIPLLVVGSGFVLHELLHKLTAQRFGFWSEFRANYTTLALSVLFAYVTHIVFAAPGATMIYGPTITKRQNGIISAAGPLLNLALAGIYLLLTPLGGFLSSIGWYGFAINVWLSAFNLLPIGPLDGRKVLNWGVPQYVAIATVPFLAAIFVIFFVFRLF